MFRRMSTSSTIFSMHRFDSGFPIQTMPLLFFCAPTRSQHLRSIDSGIPNQNLMFRTMPICSTLFCCARFDCQLLAMTHILQYSTHDFHTSFCFVFYVRTWIIPNSTCKVFPFLLSIFQPASNCAMTWMSRQYCFNWPTASSKFSVLEGSGCTVSMIMPNPIQNMLSYVHWHSNINCNFVTHVRAYTQVLHSFAVARVPPSLHLSCNHYIFVFHFLRLALSSSQPRTEFASFKHFATSFTWPTSTRDLGRHLFVFHIACLQFLRSVLFLRCPFA